MLQSIVTLYPSTTYASVPILTLLFPFVTLSGLSTIDPSSISGKSPNEKKLTLTVHYIKTRCSYAKLL